MTKARQGGSFGDLLPEEVLEDHHTVNRERLGEEGKEINKRVKLENASAGVGLTSLDDVMFGPSLKSALRPPPSAWAESANFRPFYVKRADFSPPPHATKKRRKLAKTRPRCPHLATKKRRKVVKIRPCGGWWVGGWPPSPPPSFSLI